MVGGRAVGEDIGWFVERGVDGTGGLCYVVLTDVGWKERLSHRGWLGESLSKFFKGLRV